MKGTIVIVGASITGLHAASALINNKYEGKIILIDRKETPHIILIHCQNSG